MDTARGAVYGEKLLHRFHNPRHAGEPDPAALTVRAGNPACGDLLQLSVRVEDGVIRGTKFKLEARRQPGKLHPPDDSESR